MSEREDNEMIEGKAFVGLIAFLISIILALFFIGSFGL